MNHRGFTLVELMVATAMLLTIVGAIVSLASPMRHAFERSVAAGDLAIRGRTGVEALVESLRQSGAGARIGPRTLSLPTVAAVVILHRSLDEGAAAPPYGAVTVVRVPDGAAQAVLQGPADAGTWSIRFDPSGPCPRQTGACGFVAGVAAIVYDATQSERVSVAAVNPSTSTLALGAPLTRSFTVGGVVAEIHADTYGVRSDAGGNRRLVRITEAGAEQTLVDHVGDFEVMPDDPSPILMRRVGIRLRLQTISANVPGLELRAAVALWKGQ